MPQAGAARPAVLLGYAVVDWLVILACWAAMSRFAHPVVYVVGVMIVAGRMHGLGVILHDACHRPSRRKTPTLRVVEALAGWPVGSTIDAMRYHHLRHHRASCTRHDPYWHPFVLRGAWAAELMALRGALLPFWWSLRAFCAPFALIFPRFRVIYARAFLQDRSGDDLRNAPEVTACARADLPQAAAHVAAAAATVAWQLPFVSFYLVPWIVGGICNGRRVVREHDHHELRQPTAAAVWNVTRTHLGNWLSRAFFFPHNIGYHQAHHLYPNVAFTHLPAVHAAVISDLEARAPHA